MSDGEPTICTPYLGDAAQDRWLPSHKWAEPVIWMWANERRALSAEGQARLREGLAKAMSPMLNLIRPGRK